MTIIQRETRTLDLENALPYSSQLSYQVIWQLSDWIWALKAELPGIRSEYQAAVFDEEGVTSMKCE